VIASGARAFHTYRSVAVGNSYRDLRVLPAPGLGCPLPLCRLSVLYLCARDDTSAAHRVVCGRRRSSPRPALPTRREEALFVASCVGASAQDGPNGWSAANKPATAS